ncbi:unnamed protein product, partial [marine sediment metagenome]
MNSANTIRLEIAPLSLDHVIVGVEINEADNVIFSYLSSLLEYIPCKKITYLHVVPSLPMVDVLPYEGMEDVVLDSTWIQSLENKIQQYIPKKLSAIQSTIRIREGSPLEEILKEANGKSNALFVIGQESDKHQHDI